MHTGEWIGDLPARDWPSEGRWIAKPRRARWIAPTFGLIFLTSQLPNWINVFMNGGKHSPFMRILPGALVLILVGVSLYAFVHRRLAARMRREDLAIMDGAFGDQFPTEITIVVGKSPLGSDRGVVWFADGLMGFSGHSASFVLSAEDVEPQWPGIKRRVRGRALPADSIVLNEALYEAYIVVTPLKGHERAYRERLKRFKDEDVQPDAERFWPPLEPYDASAALPQDAVRR